MHIFHPALLDLCSAGATRGWLSFEELIEVLPDEMVDASGIDRVLMQFDEDGIELIDELECRARIYRESKQSANSSDGAFASLTTKAQRVRGGDRTSEETHLRSLDRKRLEKEREASTLNATSLSRNEINRLAGDAGNANGSNSDDPVRVYLAQMGTIPLLTRDQELRLAKKIETTRLILRRWCLENDLIAAHAAEILQQVLDGKVPFDRTLRINAVDNEVRERIMQRMRTNLPTVSALLEQNRIDFEQLRTAR